MQLPKNETIKLVTGINRVMHSPKIVTGETSGSGKTVRVEVQRDSFSTDTYRLDTEKLLSGETEFRDSRYFELYTKEGMRSSQRANHAPGPVAGANEVTDPEDLPEPTHAVR